MARHSSESELGYLRERVGELEEENGILKESLEELINVNKELTESIEEFNQDNIDSSYQQEKIVEMQTTIEAMNQELLALRAHRPSADLPLTEGETESLVNVLEELIESFKNMQNRYEGEIVDYQGSLDRFRAEAAPGLLRLDEQYAQKLHTLEPVAAQLQRQQQAFQAIEGRLRSVEAAAKQGAGLAGSLRAGSTVDQATLAALREQLEQKEQLVEFYQGVLGRLRQKFSEKL